MATAQTAIQAADVAEDIKELVEDTAELVEGRISWVSSNPKALVAIASLTGVAVGVVLGFQIASKRVSKKWQEEADRQIEDVKNHYAAVQDKPSLADLASAYSDEEVEADLREAVDILEKQDYVSYDKVPVTTEAPASVIEDITITQAIVEAASADRDVIRNIFESDNPETYFDFEEELKRREEKPDQPFVITKEEFDNNETDYEQSALTYYDGDDVLCDPNDKPVDDIEMVMGHANVTRFGHGSGDPNVVYIRNNHLTLDFEVTFSEGKFAREVLGFEDGELQHSHRRPQRRFRDSDE